MASKKKKSATQGKKAATRKVANKKKVATKKVATKKVATKKVATKKAATKKATTKKAATKKKPASGKAAKGKKKAKARLTLAAFERLTISQKIRRILPLLKREEDLDPGSADYSKSTDVVVVEQDSGISGGLMVGYFFRDAAHLAAARWAARQELEDVDLNSLDDDFDIDEVEGILSGSLQGEKIVFEGSVRELLRGSEGGVIRATWRERLDEEGDDLEDEEDGDDDASNSQSDKKAKDPERPVIDPDEQDEFLGFIRSGGLG